MKENSDKKIDQVIQEILAADSINDALMQQQGVFSAVTSITDPLFVKISNMGIQELCKSHIGEAETSILGAWGVPDNKMETKIGTFPFRKTVKVYHYIKKTAFKDIFPNIKNCPSLARWVFQIVGGKVATCACYFEN
jgi:hypothetical protein